jgi:hypothetical protein
LEEWVELCKKGIACEVKYFEEKETVTAPPRSLDSE